ncbi:hypothetical protein [Nitrospira sp. Kam-Ns4a]
MAQRWARAVARHVAITTDGERSRSSGARIGEPDIVVWREDSGRRVIEWIGEVESETSLAAADTGRRWQDHAALGVPFYLFVPKGRRTAAQHLALGAGVKAERPVQYVLAGEALRI